MKHRTVFDVNIWISYFISGKATEIVDLVENNDVVFYRSNELMSELADVIGRPKFSRYFPDGTAEYILLVQEIAKHCHTQPMFKRCLDPKDNYLFDLALQSDVDFLVSGDKKVLAVSVEPPLQVLSLAAFKMAVGLEE